MCEVDRGAPTGFHEGPLQIPLGILVFLGGRPWNSTGGRSAQDANVINTIKMLLIHWGPHKTKGKWTFSRHGPRPRRHSGGADHGAHVRIAKCVSNAPHGNHWKTIGKRCVFSVHHMCTGAVTILCCAPGITWVYVRDAWFQPRN